ncbi:TPA: hypothetical protein MAW39_006025 [Klebsiella pneumoniae]|nr:hypothetical protein [Klebsiella pneumoniae]HBS9345792.1 hypothetical protein [Klebsiella pneumoniae]
MTDITELAQSLKAAANTTSDAIDRLKAFPGDELIDLSQHDGEQVDIDITMINEWYELSSPANILALVEALEKVQSKIIELQQGYEIDPRTHEIIDLQERIADLESRTVKLPNLKMLEDYLAEVAIEERKQILVGVKLEFHRACVAAGVKVEAE